MRTIGQTSLRVSRMCLGGNVFGWTADAQQSFAVLDAFAEAGGNFIDTADMYSSWVPGHTGGESERIIGRWMTTRRNRDHMIIATKVGMLEGLKGLTSDSIEHAVDESLRRLQVDCIPLYYAHKDDETTPLEETLRAFDALVSQGKVRYIAASNYTAPRLARALMVSKGEGLATYCALQPHYSLMHRSEYEGGLADLVAREGLSCLPYFGLASGFLTGKYRPGVHVTSQRASSAAAYCNDSGYRILTVLDDIAAEHSTSVAAVALAWLAAQPTVAAPIASARTTEQLNDLLPALTLELSPGQIMRLSALQYL